MSLLQPELIGLLIGFFFYNNTYRLAIKLIVFGLVYHKIAIGGGFASEKSHQVIIRLHNVEVADDVVLGKQPVLAIDQVELFGYYQVVDKVDVGVVHDAHLHFTYGEGGVVHPEVSGEGEGLFVPRFKHNLVAPFVIKIGAVDEVVFIKIQPEVGDGADEVFLKKPDVVVVDVGVLKLVAQKLHHAFVFYARYFVGFYNLDTFFWVVFGIDIRNRFRQEDGQVGLAIYGGGIHIIKNKFEMAEDAALPKVVGDVVGVYLNFVVCLVLVGIVLIGVVIYFVLNDFSQQHFCRIFARHDHHCLEFLAAGQQFEIDVLKFAFINFLGLGMITHKRSCEAVAGRFCLDRVFPVEVGSDALGGIAKNDIYKREWLAGERISNGSHDLGKLTKSCAAKDQRP